MRGAWGLLLSATLCCAATPGDVQRLRLASALRHALHSRCLYVLHEREGKLQQGLLQKSEEGTEFSFSFINVEEFEELRPNLVCNGRSMYTLWTNPETTRNVLLKISKSAKWGFTVPVAGNWTSGNAVPVWLVWTPDVAATFSGVHVPFDSHVLVAQAAGDAATLLEVFRVTKASPLRTALFATWASGELAYSPLIRFYDRRRDLEGLTLKVVTKDLPPFNSVTFKDSEVVLGGAIGRVWTTLQTLLNFTSLLTVEASLPRETLLERVRDGAADAALGDFVVSLRSGELVSFTGPIVPVRFRVFVRHPGYRKLRWDAYWAPLSPGLWAVAGGAVLALGAALCVAGRLASFEQRLLRSLDNCCFFVFGIFCMQGQTVSPTSLGGRLAYMWAYATAITLMAAYGAQLISSLTVRESTLAFKDLQGLIRRGTHHFAAVPGSWGDYILRALALLSPAADAALVGAASGCEAVEVPGYSLRAAMALVLPHASPYRRIFNHYIGRMRRSGLLMKYLVDSRSVQADVELAPDNDVSVEEVAPLLLLLVAGAVVAVLFLLLERRCSKPRPRQVLRRKRE